MMDVRLYCYACMGPLTAPDGVCPHCGHDNRVRQGDGDCLPGMMLQGQYLVGKMLGRGGFGVTYLGMDMSLQRKVAIKEYYPPATAIRERDTYTMRSRTGSEGDFAHGCERALAEGRVAARMGRVNGVVQIYSAFEANGTVYTVMEYVQGQTLTQRVKDLGGRMPWKQLIALMEPVMDTLATIHGMKVIHRDVSPDNIMIREDGTAVLLDFGAAHAFSEHTASEHSVVLRRGYAPIEQYAATGRQDGRIDQYALCATMYYALTGQRPADAAGRAFGSDALQSPRVLGADIPAHADAALLKGLSVRAEDRYPTMDDLRAALKGGSKKPAGKSKAPAIAFGIISLLTAGVIGVLALGATGALLPEATPAQRPAAVVTAYASSAPVITAAPTATATEASTPTLTPTASPSPVPTPTQAPTATPTAAPTPAPAPVKVPVYVMHGNDLLEEKTVLLMAGLTLSLNPADYAPEGMLPMAGDAVTITMGEDGQAQPGYVTFAYVAVTPVPTDTPTATPTAIPTATPTAKPTAKPTATPVAEVTVDNIRYVLQEDGTYWIPYEGGSQVHGDVMIPEQISGVPVTGLADRAFVYGMIDSIVLPEGLKYIGEYAFAGCMSIESATLPSSLEIIGDRAFEGCDFLTLIVPPDSCAEAWVKEMGIPYSYDGVVEVPPDAVADIDYDSVRVGDYITFGRYEQDADEVNGKEAIEWRVLDKQDGRVLLLSECSLDAQKFNYYSRSVAWDNSTLRTWLNEHFLNAAFSSTEQPMIMETQVIADKKVDYFGSYSYYETKDKIFLLNIEEVNRYLPSLDEKRAEATTYAQKQGADAYVGDYCLWLLRTAGSGDVMIVDAGGSVVSGYLIDRIAAVRPAMWIKLK